MIVRLFLTIDKKIFRKFYWFQVKGNDLYWGRSTKSKESICDITQTSNSEFKINVGTDFKSLQPLISKFSYHESGQIHIKSENGDQSKSKQVIAKLPSLTNLPMPHRLFCLLSKPLSEYPIENKSHIRVDGVGNGIWLNGETEAIRMFIEFFLTKSENEILPDPIIDFGVKSDHIIKQRLSARLILTIRLVKLKNIESWEPDKEILFIK